MIASRGLRAWLNQRYQELAGGLSSLIFHTSLFLVLALLTRSFIPTEPAPSYQLSLTPMAALSDGPNVPDGLNGDQDVNSFGQDDQGPVVEVPYAMVDHDGPNLPPGDVADLLAGMGGGPRSDHPLHGGETGNGPGPPGPSATGNGPGGGGGEGGGDGGGGFGFKGGGLGGRTSSQRGLHALKRGGSEASEGAVERGLRWIASHQRPDGSWHFEHRFEGVCSECSHPGNFPSTTAATGLALLPLLGAGMTHKDGPYQQVVDKGLYYLGERMLLTKDGGDLREGNMYSQGIATIAICEAYAMTGDEALRPYAQSAVDFICKAQHAGGGWRYLPGEPGDTTMLGWQLMALKSAYLAGLRVPSPTIAATRTFLDSVQQEDGSAYGYQSPGKGKTTSAVGLLCRMYTGWGRQSKGIELGARRIAHLGPDLNDLYFDYYASQVMCHIGGSRWEQFNRQLRDQLIAAQSRTGHEAGSWFNEQDPHAEVGGRLYCTTMAIMTLEVYYRYLPIYEDEAVHGGG